MPANPNLIFAPKPPSKVLTLQQFKQQQTDAINKVLLSGGTVGGGGGGLFGSSFPSPGQMPGGQTIIDTIAGAPSKLPVIGGVTATQAATAAALAAIGAPAPQGVQSAGALSHIIGVDQPQIIKEGQTLINNALGSVGGNAITAAANAASNPPAPEKVVENIVGQVQTDNTNATNALTTAGVSVADWVDTVLGTGPGGSGPGGGGPGGGATTDGVAEEFKFGSRDKFRRLFRSGRGGTLLTGGQGVTEAAASGGLKTLLGQ